MSATTRELLREEDRLALEGAPVLVGRPSDRQVTEDMFRPVWDPTRKGWLMLLGVAAALTGLLFTAIAYTFAVGVGAWGNNIPVAWAFGIINFVWWIGIGHAGTLISAILLLFQQKWRTSINRFAEAMTLFAVMQAGLFPILHLGRPWFAWWLFPYPSTLGIWPQFKSALMWDVFAVSTYFTVSLLFWYVGLLPDLAALRDASKKKAARIAYGIFSLGWRGSASHWRHWRIAYLLLAGLSTPLVLSVHTIVSFDFAISQLPGWHTTIFPPYFVAGAIFSGFAMVLTLMIPARKVFGFEHVITQRHIDNMTKVLLATGLMVSYGYAMEHFIAWYSGNPYESYVFFHTRQRGPYAPVYWLMMFCNVLVPQLFWIPSMRRNMAVVWVASILVNVGMWTERFNIIVTSLHRDFLPSSWANYMPTWVDLSIYAGTVGFFGFLFLLFLRFVPSVSASEVKELRVELDHADHARAAAAGHAHAHAAPEHGR
ncbi:MAG TPA: NrfD/PsrC family molybdoenzyme membrane anchor subunit [Anaeromyxobacteraceae bacterium]|nr:NrfD/PsrC family molybdoenzyme membrane anchor subunit [Anaeromyxobacteraceae bacterium]